MGSVFKINDYGMLEAYYTELTKLVDNMVDQIKTAKDVVDKMNNRDHWDGKGYDSYQRKFSALASNFGAYCNDIYKLNNNIKTTIEKLKAVDEALKGSISF